MDESIIWKEPVRATTVSYCSSRRRAAHPHCFVHQQWASLPQIPGRENEEESSRFLRTRGSEDDDEWPNIFCSIIESSKAFM